MVRPVVAPDRDRSASGECDAQHDRRQRPGRRSSHMAGHLQSPHPEVMHAGDAGADDCAAERRRPRVDAPAATQPGDGDEVATANETAVNPTS